LTEIDATEVRVTKAARVTSQWNGKNLHPNPAEVEPGAENLPLISPLGIINNSYGKIEIGHIEQRHSDLSPNGRPVL